MKLYVSGAGSLFVFSKETHNLLDSLDQTILSLGKSETLASLGKLLRTELVGKIKCFLPKDGSRVGFRNVVL